MQLQGLEALQMKKDVERIPCRGIALQHCIHIVVKPAQALWLLEEQPDEEVGKRVQPEIPAGKQVGQPEA